MIEPCPNCGKEPVMESFCTFYVCKCDGPGAIYISGPVGDTESGHGWNAMVQRIRANCAATIVARPAVAYPERMRAEKAEAKLAELRSAIHEAYTRLGETMLKGGQVKPGGMTWDQLNAVAKPGDRATCGAFLEDRFIECEATTSDLDDEFDWVYSERRNFDPLVEWKQQTDWRLL